MKKELYKIRKAQSSDNSVLLDIQSRSPQGTYFVIQPDSSPNYFNRTKPYNQNQVFVAEKDETIVGSASCAFVDTILSDIECKSAYVYGIMVDPDHRKKGIATEIGKSLNEYIEHENVDFSFAMIIEGNVASLKLVEKLGYTHFHDFLRITLMIQEGERPNHPEHIRSMEESDAAELSNLLNEYYKHYDLYKPFTEKSLLDEINRYPFFEIEDISLYENENGIQASLGYWDYDKITRYSILKLPDEMREAIIESKASFIPEVGTVLSHYYSTYQAYRNEHAFTDLVKHVTNILVERNVQNITIPVNAGTKMHTLLSEFPHAVGNTHFMAKPKKGGVFPNWGKNPVYVETAHI